MHQDHFYTKQIIKSAINQNNTSQKTWQKVLTVFMLLVGSIVAYIMFR